MYTISDYSQIIETELKEISLSGSPVSLYEPVKYMINLGGKRIRPILTLLANELFEGDLQTAIKPALAMEMFHNFTLVHDDILDRSDLRRGSKTVHKKWNEATAILSGDVMLVLAYELLNDVSPDKLAEILRLFNTTAKKVCEGQQLDMMYENTDEISIDQYIEMIGKKTAALLAGSLKMGALLANSSAEEAEDLYLFGHYAGIAFQVQDDLLDAYGEDGQWGKIRGGDIVSNKKTFLAIKALELAKGNVLAELKDLSSNKEIDHETKVLKTISIFNSLGIRGISEDVRDKYFDSALNYLEKIKVKEERKQNLKEIAGALINRQW
jgi:geranylgeranyl diphosphate synthase type II